MEVNVKMVGARELEEFLLHNVPATVARRSMLASLRKGALPMQNYAKATVARRSGALAQAIGMQTLSTRTTKRMPNGDSTFAAVRMGPLSGQGAKALSAWAIYQAYYRRGKISLKKGAPIGRIRHGHLVEFGFTMRDGRRYPGRPFMEPAAVVGGPSLVKTFVRDTRKRVDAAIRRHNARSPAAKR